ncbi:MAG: regulatory protein RecX [Sphingomonadales bacterium]
MNFIQSLLWVTGETTDFLGSFGEMYKKALTPEQALQKLRHYCAYQERSHQDVRDKLQQLGCAKKEQEGILSKLIEDDYLNKERFALAFAGGKWRTKHWGRNRIRYELKQKRVSDYCIKKALQQIEEEEYQTLLLRLAKEKYASLAKHQYIVRYKKTTDYLISRGFEPELIRAALSDSRSDKK